MTLSHLTTTTTTTMTMRMMATVGSFLLELGLSGALPKGAIGLNWPHDKFQIRASPAIKRQLSKDKQRI